MSNLCSAGVREHEEQRFDLHGLPIPDNKDSRLNRRPELLLIRDDSGVDQPNVFLSHFQPLEVAMREPKMYAFIIDLQLEEKLKNKIMQILRRRVKGEHTALRQSQIHKKIGSKNKALYLCYLLESLQSEEKIMKDGKGVWSVWNSRRNIAQRAWRLENRRQIEEWEAEWANSPLRIAERQRQQAKERQELYERLSQMFYEFFDGDEEVLFDLLCRIYYKHQPRQFKHSMLNY